MLDTTDKKTYAYLPDGTRAQAWDINLVSDSNHAGIAGHGAKLWAASYDDDKAYLHDIFTDNGDDVLLSLSVAPNDIFRFDGFSARRIYTTSVAHDVGRVTINAAPNFRDATLSYRDSTGGAIDDQDDTSPGFQASSRTFNYGTETPPCLRELGSHHGRHGADDPHPPDEAGSPGNWAGREESVQVHAGRGQPRVQHRAPGAPWAPASRSTPKRMIHLQPIRPTLEPGNYRRKCRESI